MLIAYMNVSIIGYLLQVINIHRPRENIQDYVLDHLDFNHNSIDTYI